jgi:hypothetical protein
MVAKTMQTYNKKKAGGTEVPPALHSQVRFRLLAAQAGRQLVLNMALVTQ